MGSIITTKHNNICLISLDISVSNLDNIGKGPSNISGNLPVNN